MITVWHMFHLLLLVLLALGEAGNGVSGEAGNGVSGDVAAGSGVAGCAGGAVSLSGVLAAAAVSSAAPSPPTANASAPSSDIIQLPSQCFKTLKKTMEPLFLILRPL